MKSVIWGLAGLSMMSGAVAAEVSPVNISGAVEVEAADSEDYSGAHATDIVLATVELALDADINERLSAHVAFLYEEDETDFGIDEGTMTYSLTDGMAVTAGKMYVPFGRFDSFMVSDPQTLEMAETVETVLMLSAESQGMYGSAYLFNGDSDELDEVDNGDNDGLSAGFNIGYTNEDTFDVGVSYISNIGDSDTLQALETTGAAVGVVDSRVAGLAGYFSLGFGQVTVVGEYVTALESFANGDLDDTVTQEEQPTAANLEVGIGVTDALVLAAGYQQTDEAVFIGLPETVVSASIAYALNDGGTLSAEYAVMDDYETDEGGSGESANAFTVQWAVEF